MNLKNLTNILRSGNAALGQKLQNLLTEDCTILEYTDDSVLFQKNNYVVLATFKHDLNESKLTSDSIIDNEVLYISAKDTEKELKESLVSIVDSLVEDNFVQAEEQLKDFCEQYFQFTIIKSKFPHMFTENLRKKSPGFKLRKQATKAIPGFKSDLFSIIALKEDKQIDVAEYTSLIESNGSVLFLGKEKVKNIVLDSVFGSLPLAENITDKLFLVATSLVEANEEIKNAVDKGFDLDSGSFADETPEEIATEDYDLDDSIETEFPEEEGPSEFTEFDPSKLSDEEIRDLHKTVLKSILNGMQEFVTREANNPKNADVAGDMDESLKLDLNALSGDELTDEELSQIEARWQPVISYFLDSDLYTPEQDLGAEEVELSSIEDKGIPVEQSKEAAQEIKEPESQEEVPPVPSEAAKLPEETV